MKKDDRSSHQLSINVPNFNANKGGCLPLDIRCSRKAVECLPQNISLCLKHKLSADITKTESETNSNKRKTSWSSTKCSWNEEDIFKRYSRNLDFSQIIFWVCHMKKYSENAMSMILDNVNLIFWVLNKFDAKQEIC